MAYNTYIPTISFLANTVHSESPPNGKATLVNWYVLASFIFVFLGIVEFAIVGITDKIWKQRIQVSYLFWIIQFGLSKKLSIYNSWRSLVFSTVRYAPGMKELNSNWDVKPLSFHGREFRTFLLFFCCINLWWDSDWVSRLAGISVDLSVLKWIKWAIFNF